MADLKSRRNLSFSEESDLSCEDVLERSSQKSKADVSTRPTKDAVHSFVVCFDRRIQIVIIVIIIIRLCLYPCICIYVCLFDCILFYFTLFYFAKRCTSGQRPPADIFDLVSGIQREAMREERREKERRRRAMEERMRAEERERERGCEGEADRERANAGHEVFAQRGDEWF